MKIDYIVSGKTTSGAPFGVIFITRIKAEENTRLMRKNGATNVRLWRYIYDGSDLVQSDELVVR